MRSIETAPGPLAFPVKDASRLYDRPAGESDTVSIRTLATALTGMQKEALVFNGASGQAWRMVCDEGPYLNGTDLAPFPLAFFAVGLILSFMREIEALAETRGVSLSGLTLVQDNRYTMEGSALKGSMVGGALPVELTAQAGGPADDDTLRQLVSDAVAGAPVSGLLKDTLTSLFTLTHNGEAAPPARVAALKGQPLADPAPVFDRAVPDPDAEFADDIILKTQSAEQVTGEGGAGSSLQAEQKRVLHMQTVARRRDDGLVEATIHLFNPKGSQFRFLGDIDSTGRAPQGLDYLSAGIAFCYLTQMGRFAHIAKLTLDNYRIVQDTGFSVPGTAARRGTAPLSRPVETHVHVDSPADRTDIQRLTDMSEQTCFLHAACRTPLKTKIKIDRNAAAA